MCLRFGPLFPRWKNSKIFVPKISIFNQDISDKTKSSAIWNIKIQCDQHNFPSLKIGLWWRYKCLIPANLFLWFPWSVCYDNTSTALISPTNYNLVYNHTPAHLNILSKHCLCCLYPLIFNLWHEGIHFTYLNSLQAHKRFIISMTENGKMCLKF